MGERKIERETGAGERWVERQGRKRKSDRGKEKKLQTQKNSWNFILSCFNPVTGNHHSCYGLKRTFRLVKPKFMTLLSKNVYKTEIDKLEPKLWRFTLGTLILGHPVAWTLLISTLYLFISIIENTHGFSSYDNWLCRLSIYCYMEYFLEEPAH